MIDSLAGKKKPLVVGDRGVGRSNVGVDYGSVSEGLGTLKRSCQHILWSRSSVGKPKSVGSQDIVCTVWVEGGCSLKEVPMDNENHFKRYHGSLA